MDKKRISELTSLTTADPLDIIPIVDIDEPIIEQRTKKISVNNLLSSVVDTGQIPYQTTGLPPTSSPSNGSLVLDFNGGTTTLWARSNNTWVALISV